MFKLITPIAIIAVFSALILGYGFQAVTANSNEGKPHFNSYGADVAPYGDESDFVQLKRPNASGYTDKIEACEGEVTMRIYIHNGASADLNGENFDGPGVATGTSLKVDAQNLSAVIDADNAAAVTDTAQITCADHDIEIKGIESLIWTKDAQNYNKLDSALFSGGTAIGYESQDGIWPGCWEFLGSVFVKLAITPVQEPEPEPTPEPELACEIVHATVSTKDEEATIDTEVSATAKNAEIHSYTYAFNDPNQNTPTVINTDESSYEHIVQLGDKARTVNIGVTTNFDTDNDGKADQTVTCNDTAEIPASPTLVVEPAKCEVVGKEDLDADHADCKVDETVVTPPVKPADLPKTIASTGPAEQAVAFASILALAGAVFYYRRSQALSKFGL